MFNAQKENKVQTDYRSITLLYHAGSGSGMGGKVAPQVAEKLRALYVNAELEVIETRSREHIAEVGRTSEADLIICLSGDGSIHDLAQTLVERADDKRPILASIPAGSGNDYARTLGMPLDPLKAVAALPECEVVKADVGRVNDTYFLETLSFGVDAAVALNTEELRLTTKARGGVLYAHAAINAILHEFEANHVKVRMAEGEYQLKALILAVQNGPTYGGGFRVAPNASIVDGLLDVYIVSGIKKPTALYYLTQMKNGKHEHLKGFSYHRTSQLELEFDKQVPAQCDGERLLGLSFSVDVVPAAIEVLKRIENFH